MEPKRLAIDFDSTLTMGDESYFTDGRETANPFVVDWVNDRYIDGHTILIHTARPERVRPETEAWLAGEGVRYHALVMGKLSADVYIDDKSYHPEMLVGSDLDELLAATGVR